ncbi:methylated-DNA--[protein]-cysteine S-methyltransferase [Gilvibacter sp.]|uniref:methylated-DNA--[protein]-cysteine S-methyltransferase n=1 Tax=Gilvibacter sp. TaxID=2729997 RepID=UPI0025C12921|nr:methylated-DNA--[protein]-cysteine S-methyltransferase [Gilvibacter sp.]NQX76249.1 methylated-DNA--[protein]-cysteine S-methyltransferase [Gilvibacter sp.]
MTQSAYLDSPLGTLLLEGDADGIQKLSALDTAESPSAEIPEPLQDAARQIQDYFKGNRNDFDLKLNPQGTAFQQQVWKQLLEIPFGKTTSYMDMAKSLGDPKTIRAAASANGKNPIMIIIPCHRVIASDGGLTGYAGGLWRKQWLLEHESPVTQQKLF